MKDSVQSAATVWKFIAAYYAIACGISWVLWAPIVLGQDGLRVSQFTPDNPAWVMVGTVGPLAACFITHRIETGNWRVANLISSRTRQIVWILLSPLLVLASVFLVFPALVSKGSPTTWRWHASALAAIPSYLFGYNLLGGPLFEEFGWRGFVQSRLQRRLAPWAAALCVGAMWAAWHFPLFLVRGWTSASPMAYLFLVLGLSLVMAFGFNASGQSIITAILMHSAFNVSTLQLGEFLRGTALREHPAGEWLIAASFWLVGVSVLLLTRGSLGLGTTGEDVSPSGMNARMQRN